MIRIAQIGIPGFIREYLLQINIPSEKRYDYNLPNGFPYSDTIRELIYSSNIPATLNKPIKFLNTYSITKLQSDEYLDFHTKAQRDLSDMFSIFIANKEGYVGREFSYVEPTTGVVQFVKPMDGTIIAYSRELMHSILPLTKDKKITILNVAYSL